MSSRSSVDHNADNEKSRNECAGFPSTRRRHLMRRWCGSLVGSREDEQGKAWSRTFEGHKNRARLEAMRGRHWGKRCFVLGNGPSLNQCDLSLLRDEFVIGTNRIYLHDECKSWRRWYYCAVNPNVISQFGSEIGSLDALRFLAWEHRDKISNPGATVWLRTKNQPRFSFDLSQGMWQGATVTYVALQLAFHLGFTDVVLLGVDHHYDRAGQPNKLVRSEGDDPDHFAPGYFGAGYDWQLPDLAQSEIAYRLARLAYEQEGRRIRDATIGGKLSVFPKAVYEELF